MAQGIVAVAMQALPSFSESVHLFVMYPLALTEALGHVGVHSGTSLESARKQRWQLVHSQAQPMRTPMTS